MILLDTVPNIYKHLATHITFTIRRGRGEGEGELGTTENNTLNNGKLQSSLRLIKTSPPMCSCIHSLMYEPATVVCKRTRASKVLSESILVRVKTIPYCMIHCGSYNSTCFCMPTKTSSYCIQFQSNAGQDKIIMKMNNYRAPASFFFLNRREN